MRQSARIPLHSAGIDHLDWLESEAIHILREVAGQCRNPALLFSGGKDSLVLLRLAEKAFRPGPVSLPAAAHRYRPQFSGGHRVPRSPCRRARRAADRALGGGLDRVGTCGAEAPTRESQPAPVGDAARRHCRVRLRRLHRRCATRRGKGARQGADILVPRCVRPMGPEEPAPGALESLQRAHASR